MKILSIAFAGLVFTNVSFAETAIVTGNKAIQLRNALNKAGAEKTTYPDATFTNIKNLACVELTGFRLEPMKCIFVDESSGQLKELDGQKASNFAKSLVSAGLKEIRIRRGEYSRREITATAISCYSTALPKAWNCRIDQ